MLCKKFCECKKLKSSNISVEMFQIIVCLLYRVILGRNFNVNFLRLLNEINLLLNEFDPLLILYSYRFVPRKRKFFFITDTLLTDTKVYL